MMRGTWGSAQVDQEIDDYEDLLAVESSFSSNEITPLRAILPVPEGFNGQRLTRPQSSASISSDNRARIIRPDGSYTFRRTEDTSNLGAGLTFHPRVERYHFSLKPTRMAIDQLAIIYPRLRPCHPHSNDLKMLKPGD
eukprot:TCALIF_08007-PA protein Name:"Protein of unknown function" AED:0.18 eAED:0.43 QI:192/0/0.33/1/0/0/3/0/137